MTTNNKLFAYTCDSCGGRLVLDKEKNVFICHSCGNTYDYEYFMGEDILNKASEALKVKEFSTAFDMYEFLLKKEPDNFEGLYGSLFAAYHFAGPKDLTPDRFVSMPKTPSSLPEDSYIDRYINATDESHREFFELFDECKNLGVTISERSIKIAEMEKKVKEMRSKVNALSGKEALYYVSGSKKYDSADMPPKDFVRTSAIILGVITLGSVLFAFLLNESAPLIMAVGSIIAFIAIYFGNKPKIDAVDALEKQIFDMNVEIEKELIPLRELEDANSKDRSTIANKAREMKRFI